jgi:hypothetical protein
MAEVSGRRPHAAAIAVCGLFVLAAGYAMADDAAVAETLFQQGRTLMAQGKTAEACKKFAESHRIDAATGTLLNLAACRQAQGMLATAWAHFKEAETASRRDGRPDRVRFAREQLAAIEPRLSYITIRVAPASRVPGLLVKLDDLPISEAAWNVPTPVDPGLHKVSATAPDRAPFVYRLTATTTASKMEVMVSLDAASAAAPPGAAPALEVDRPPERHRRLDAPVWIAGAVTASGVLVGSVFGLKAMSQSSDRNEECPMDICSPKGQALERDAKRSAMIADIAFATAAVGAGVGIYLLFFRDGRSGEVSATGARDVAAVPLVSPSAAGLAVQGWW